MSEDMDQEPEDPTALVGPVDRVDLVDLADLVELEDQANPVDPAARVDLVDPDQDSSEDAGEETVAVAVDTADPKSAQEDTPVASTPTSLTLWHTRNTNTRISSHNGSKTRT